MAYINHNGKITEDTARVLPHDNRAFRYGHGIFETMLVRDGVIQLADYHWQRLFESAKSLYIEIPKLLTPAVLQEQVLKTVARNNLSHLCRVRLQLYAGTGGLYDAQHNSSGYLIECFPLDVHIVEPNEAGLVTGIATGLQKAADALANHKTSNALIYAIAARQAKENKWNDALVQNTSGNIIESTIANIFWSVGHALYTPPLADGCIAGVMRRHIMETLPVTEATLTADVLQNAESVYLTNAIRRIKWVRSVGNAQYSAGAIYSLYRKLFA